MVSHMEMCSGITHHGDVQWSHTSWRHEWSHTSWIRAVVSHIMNDGTECPIAYASRTLKFLNFNNQGTLTSAEKNYSQLAK